MKKTAAGCLAALGALAWMSQAPVTFEPVPPSESGIRWKHENGKSPAKHLPETVGSGCVFFDYDNDGWLDIYLVNSGSSLTQPARNALYRNNGTGGFEDVTEKAGVAGGQFGMGAAAADFNGDGWLDLYVTAFGRNLLYQNNGDGTFREVGEKAGVAVQGWSTHAVWFDYDGDGRPDLFVSSFVDYDPEQNRFCGDPAAKRQHYCLPRVFRPRSSYLFRNNGDGTFADVSQQTGIAAVKGKSFGAVATDINNDGKLDLFVANDTMPNFLFLNRGGKFEEVGLLAGVAYSEAGLPRSGMGVDAADVDGDGWQDLFVANIDQEMFSLYRNTGAGDFVDEDAEIRLHTRLLSGWGLKFFDYDNDGDPDLLLANGHPDDMIELLKPSVGYKEPLLLFANEGGKFRNVSARSGKIFQQPLPARGLAVGDYDNDGDLDVLISNNGEAPLLLRNEGGNRNGWIGLELEGRKSDPSGVGAQIIWTVGGVTRRRLKTAGGSYLASHDPREILGLGTAERVDAIEIRWPSGEVDRLGRLPGRQYVRLREGAGGMSAPRSQPVRAPSPKTN